MPTGIEILTVAVKRLPSLKYALGVAGVVSVLAIVASLKLDLRVAGLGSVIVLIFMGLILLFSRLANLPTREFRIPALVFLWFSVLLLIASASLLVSSVFSGWPLDIKQFVAPKPGQQPAQADLRRKLVQAPTPADADALLDELEQRLFVEGPTFRENMALELAAVLAKFHPTTDNSGPDIQYRDIRIRILNLFRSTATKDWNQYLAKDTFAHANLMDFDFHDAYLAYMNFNDTFMLRTNFSGADLTGATFLNVSVKGAQFSNALLESVRFSAIDWFNAYTFDVSALSSQQRAMLDLCADSIESFIKRHDEEYGTPFEALESTVQNRLRALWAGRLKPGADCQLVAEARASTE